MEITETTKQFVEENLWKRALDLMPRGTQTMSKCPDQFVDGVYPKFALAAEGAYISCFTDMYEISKSYLDYMCALGPIILGYNNESVNYSVRKQLEKGTIFSLPTLLESRVAKLVVETVPCAEQVRFGKNGTDVTLAAVRIARSYTGKEHIAKCGYHGWGDWHGITLRDYGIPSTMKDIVHEFEYNNINSLENILKNHEVAGIIMEVESLEVPKSGFLENIRKLADQYNAILIFDEVVTGYRWSLGGAQEYYGVTPDLTCLGKAIANGFPLSAICGKRKFMKELDHVFFSMTFGGDCIALAAAEATITELKIKDYNHIWKLGRMLDDGIKAMASYHNLKINFKGSGPRHNLSFSDTYTDKEGMKALFYQEMCKQNILFPNVIYISFAHTEEDIAKTIVAANNAFKIVADNVDDIDKVLEGQRSTSIFKRE